MRLVPQMLGSVPRPKNSWWDCGGIWLCCPGCGHVTRLDRDGIEIGPDGSVTPRYECAAPGCTFEDVIKLDGYGEAIL